MPGGRPRRAAPRTPPRMTRDSLLHTGTLARPAGIKRPRAVKSRGLGETHGAGAVSTDRPPEVAGHKRSPGIVTAWLLAGKGALLCNRNLLTRLHFTSTGQLEAGSRGYRNRGPRGQVGAGFEVSAYSALGGEPIALNLEGCPQLPPPYIMITEIAQHCSPPPIITFTSRLVPDASLSKSDVRLPAKMSIGAASVPCPLWVISGH